MNKIGLCMIVRNESPVIERCLNSVKPLLDYVLIVDTGSTDDTIARISQWLEANQLQGRVLEHPWEDFATNRSFALESLRRTTVDKVDYVLMIDADEVLEFNDNCDITAFKNSLEADLYNVMLKFNGEEYLRPQIFRNDKPYFFKGIVHEYLECLEPIVTRGRVNEFCFRVIQDSDRNKSGNKFEKDAKLLSKALKEETDEYLILRYTFYLAQTFRDLGRFPEAITYYKKRAAMGHWVEEVYWSLYQIAKLKQKLEYEPAGVVQAYLAAHEICPWRAEALHGAAKLAREQKWFQQAYILSKHGLDISYPSDSLFMEKWIYDYAMLDEFAVAAYWVQKYHESLTACEKLLAANCFPAHEKKRIRQNLDFALQEVSKSKAEQAD